MKFVISAFLFNFLIIGSGQADISGIVSQKIENTVSAKIENTASAYVSNLSEIIPNYIPGKGTTEVSIELRDNYKPDFSILAVRELNRSNYGNTFLQFSLFNTEKQNKERFVTNLGLGKRFLSDDKLIMTGINTFLDYDTYGNIRGSFGGELKNASFSLTSNYYKKIKNGSDLERVLNGYDIELSSQIPHLHWADVFVNRYKWYGVLRDDVEGTKYGSELSLLPLLDLEIAYDDKDKKGLKDEYYAKLIFVYPPKTKGATALDGISKLMWVEEKDMTDQLLTKVKRQNKIFVELSGAATISRLD